MTTLRLDHCLLFGSCYLSQCEWYWWYNMHYLFKLQGWHQDDLGRYTVIQIIYFFWVYACAVYNGINNQNLTWSHLCGKICDVQQKDKFKVIKILECITCIIRSLVVEKRCSTVWYKKILFFRLYELCSC